jgi:2-amino-4-hydroxy-6-hydroxymethyldihydropteridine diphosphokinase
MIFIGLGANLTSAAHGPPAATCAAALGALAGRGVAVRRRSRWYRSAPLPPSDQPWYVNGVAEVETGLNPAELLALMHGIETAFGRVRDAVDGARVIDLDLLDYGGRLSAGPDAPVLPHPRLHQRGFVLYPLQELAPGWRHPGSGAAIRALIAALPAGQQCTPEEALPETP